MTKFDYTIFKDNSQSEFKKACKLIERSFPDSKKNKLLIDVDGSTIQTNTKDGKDIDVYDDFDVGAVIVKSEIDLDNIFS